MYAVLVLLSFLLLVATINPISHTSTTHHVQWIIPGRLPRGATSPQTKTNQAFNFHCSSAVVTATAKLEISISNLSNAAPRFRQQHTSGETQFLSTRAVHVRIAGRKCYTNQQFHPPIFASAPSLEQRAHWLDQAVNNTLQATIRTILASLNTQKHAHAHKHKQANTHTRTRKHTYPSRNLETQCATLYLQRYCTTPKLYNESLHCSGAPSSANMQWHNPTPHDLYLNQATACAIVEQFAANLHSTVSHCHIIPPIYTHFLHQQI